jgi:hypothetical protein
VGETAAETLTEIEATRARLDGELRVLEERLPAVGRLAKRVTAALVGIGVLGAVTRFALRRRRSQRDDGRVREIENRVARLEHRLDD